MEKKELHPFPCWKNRYWTAVAVKTGDLCHTMDQGRADGRYRVTQCFYQCNLRMTGLFFGLKHFVHSDYVRSSFSIWLQLRYVFDIFFPFVFDGEGSVALLKAWSSLIRSVIGDLIGVLRCGSLVGVLSVTALLLWIVQIRQETSIFDCHRIFRLLKCRNLLIL